MAVPKHRGTKSKQNQRRMHLFLQAPVLGFCPKCKKPIKSHTVCSNCGFYKGREIIDVMKKLEKKEQKKRAKEIKETEKQEAKETKETKQKPMSLEELSKQKF